MNLYTQSFDISNQFKHYDETMKRVHGCKYQHCKPELKKTTVGPAKDNNQASTNYLKVKSIQRSRNDAIKTQIQPSKPKREITSITNRQNKKRTYGQPSEQLFPKRWPLNNHNRTKNNVNTRMVKRHRNSDAKEQAIEKHNKVTALERSVINYWGA